jgi:hypothetical protein
VAFVCLGKRGSCDTLVQYAACWIVSELRLGHERAQFDSDYSVEDGGWPFSFLRYVVPNASYYSERKDTTDVFWLYTMPLTSLSVFPISQPLLHTLQEKPYDLGVPAFPLKIHGL